MPLHTGQGSNAHHQVETFLIRHTLTRPVGPASAQNTSRQTVVVRLASRAGLVGWGETYALAGVRAAIDQVLAPLVVGQDPLRDAGRLWQRLWDASFGNGFAVGGIDMALHDLRGKALGVPIHQLYGGARRSRVALYASSGYVGDLEPAEQWPAEISRPARARVPSREAQNRQVPASSMSCTVLERLRASVPEDFKLMVDVWGAYTPPMALSVGRELQRLGVDFYEEPLPQAGYVGYEALAAQLDMPIAGGEMLQTRAAFKELFERRAVDIVQPDVSICGGIGECLFVADLARLYGHHLRPAHLERGDHERRHTARRGRVARRQSPAGRRTAAARVRLDREPVHDARASRSAEAVRRRVRRADGARAGCRRRRSLDPAEQRVKQSTTLHVPAGRDADAIELPLLIARGDATARASPFWAASTATSTKGSSPPRLSAQDLDPETLSGTVQIVSVANPPAFEAGTRTSPIDGVNLARTFPGQKDGSAYRTHRRTRWPNRSFVRQTS